MLRKRVVLGELEVKVLGVLWDRGACTVQEVLDGLPPDGERHYNTCSTVLTRLVRRGLVDREREGRSYRFVARVTRDELGAEYLARLREDLFGGSIEAIVAALLAPGKTRKSHAARLRKMLDEIEGEGG